MFTCEFQNLIKKKLYIFITVPVIHFLKQIYRLKLISLNLNSLLSLNILLYKT